MKLGLVLLLLGVVAVCGEVYFKETFDKDWENRWVVSNWKKSSGDAGKWKLTAGDWYGDAEEDKGIQTSQDAKFYAITSKMSKEFDNKDKTLVVQFSVKHGQKIDCGGGYIKLFPKDLDQAEASGDSKYNIMFGPDVCGTSTKKTHVIFNYKGNNLLTKKNINCETDQLTHVYTLIVKSDNTYEVRIDGDKKESGKLADDWDMLKPKKIKDPAVSKPKDWVDEAQIDDPQDTKPADYDDTPKTIPDPEAQKPEDWDVEADGEWEAPVIDNPEYKGEWKAKRIANPEYKGKWVHPEIDNPEFVDDDQLHAYTTAFVGFDLWQVKSGSIFDNIIVTDNVKEAEEFMAETYGKNKDGEKAMFDKAEAERKEKEDAERKRIEEERKAQEKDEKDGDDDEEEEDEEAEDEEEGEDNEEGEKEEKENKDEL